MAWSNQTLATIVLWAITVYLVNENKFYWITLIPSIFMTAVVTTYLMAAPEGFELPLSIAYLTGFFLTALVVIWFIFFIMKYRKYQFEAIKVKSKK